MSETTAKRSSGNVGTPFYLFLLILTLLLGVVTAYAVKNNPLRSDRDAYGVSKFMFIEHCKEEVHDTAALPTTVVINNQPVGQDTFGKLAEQFKLLKTGESLDTRTTVTSAEIVRQVQPLVNAPDAAPRTGLQLQMPVEVYAVRRSDRRPLAQGVVQCEYDKARGTTTANLLIRQ